MSLAADYEKLRLRDAICGDAKGRAAYLALIEFDPNLSSDYSGFVEACQRVGLAALTEEKYSRLWREYEENDD
jgi:hypothetical protein